MRLCLSFPASLCTTSRRCHGQTHIPMPCAHAVAAMHAPYCLRPPASPGVASRRCSGQGRAGSTACRVPHMSPGGLACGCTSHRAHVSRGCLENFSKEPCTLCASAAASASPHDAHAGHIRAAGLALLPVPDSGTRCPSLSAAHILPLHRRRWMRCRACPPTAPLRTEAA